MYNNVWLKYCLQRSEVFEKNIIQMVFILIFGIHSLLITKKITCTTKQFQVQKLKISCKIICYMSEYGGLDRKNNNLSFDKNPRQHQHSQSFENAKTFPQLSC